MIIARSPLRISLGGGGTDLPSYYKEHGGFLIAGAINKYVYTTMQQTPRKSILLRYSKIEEVEAVRDIKHPIIREALRLLEITDTNIEITSMADIPAGTGLGSSGSFATCLLKAIHKYKKSFIHPKELAEMACHIEIDILKEPIGKQDQYIAAFGGLTCFNFEKDGTVRARSLKVSNETMLLLEDNLLMFSTGYYRAASSVLQDQDNRSKVKDPEMVNNLHYVKELGHRSLEALESGELSIFGKLMHEHWENKKKRSNGMSNQDIDRWYNIALDNGAIGGKVIGAGGGGFLMFYTEEKTRLRKAMAREGLHEVRFGFDYEGTKII
ncbi:galactokinase [bacterium]|nr:galactokinase [bacterium]